MSLQTGGFPSGGVSTRARAASWANFRARSVGTMPTVSPLGPTSRTSGTRILSLMRSSVLMCPPDGHVTGSPCRHRAPEEVRNQQRLPLVQAEASRGASHANGSAIEGREAHAVEHVHAAGQAFGTGPDGLWCRAAVRVGDDAADSACEICSVSAADGRVGTDRSTQDASRRFLLGP